MTEKQSKYRAILDYDEKEKRFENELKAKYTKHVEAYGGLFTPDMRKKLLGKNPKNNKPYEDTARDWSNIRKSVKNGLIDIQMICEIASFSQIEKMFEHTLDYPNQGKGGEISIEDYYKLSTNLVSAIRSILRVNVDRDPKQHAEKTKLEEKRREIVKSKIIGLEEERRKLSLNRLKLEERLQKYSDKETLIEKTRIENEIKEIDFKIRIENKPIEIINSKILYNDPKLQLWKAKLAKLMIRECLNFFNEKHLIRSEIHTEYLNKVNLIIDSELSRYI